MILWNVVPAVVPPPADLRRPLPGRLLDRFFHRRRRRSRTAAARYGSLLHGFGFGGGRGPRLLHLGNGLARRRRPFLRRGAFHLGRTGRGCCGFGGLLGCGLFRHDHWLLCGPSVLLRLGSRNGRFHGLDTGFLVLRHFRSLLEDGHLGAGKFGQGMSC